GSWTKWIAFDATSDGAKSDVHLVHSASVNQLTEVRLEESVGTQTVLMPEYFLVCDAARHGAENDLPIAVDDVGVGHGRASLEKTPLLWQRPSETQEEGVHALPPSSAD